jgi:alanine dehydrogenase
VIVDVAVDQGGCFETTHPTTHAEPVYFVDGVLHYAVANMPGALPRTSTIALTNATLPYALKLAGKGLRGALRSDPGFMAGLNTCGGQITCPPVAESLGLPFVDPAGLV